MWFPTAAAATSCPSTPGPQTVTFSLLATPAEQTCVIPDGVSSASLEAVGAPGGDAYKGSGGAGAVVTGSLTGLSDGETLYVEVGGPGGAANSNQGSGAGGFNGGGSGNSGGGGG
ncbi:MAG TPA: hypothetical protein VIJ20_07630, partial [Solirubrobacteraceae bacterium]